jgi:hypothetical protein
MTRHIACLALLLALSGTCLADDPPDSEVNPQTGFIETVTTVWNGSSHDVGLTIDRGALPPLTAAVAAGSTDDLDPRVAIAASGEVSVTWTRDGSMGQVFVRARTAATWGLDQLVSDPSEDSRNPELVYYGSAPALVYEIHGETTKSVAVSIIGDEPDPFGARSILASTAWSGDIDARVQTADGHLWVTWIQDDSEVGWSELDGSGSWTTAAYQSYSADDTDSARSTIREAVLGL